LPSEADRGALPRTFVDLSQSAPFARSEEGRRPGLCTSAPHTAIWSAHLLPSTMPTLIGERSAHATTFAPPAHDLALTTVAASETTRPHGFARRLLERFALIALGLYHLPLFLNNYPSLGGGGFSQDGLAPAWGHVFTPPGVWVARHVFNMTGPMPSAYQGDNGDVGEEFGRLLLSIVIAAIGAAVWSIADHRRPRARWVGDALQVMLRYAIALGLTSYAIAKILPLQFPPLSVRILELRVGELSPMSLLWTFMQYSRPYAFFGGVMELVAVLLLCFRRTATLGALVCLGVMTNVALLNLGYGVPVKLYSIVICISAAILVLYSTPRLWALLVQNRAVPAPVPSTLSLYRIPAAARWSIKGALVGSVMVSSVVAMWPSTNASSAASPLDGAWAVTSFAVVGQSRDSLAAPAKWRRLIVQGGSAGIRLDTDAMIGCRQTPVDANTIKLACSRNRAGELKWTRTANVVQLDGTFDGARVTASARFVELSEYPLLRSEFRWISDR
jgi:hypothetical protein